MRLIDADDLKKTWYKEHNIEPGESGAMFVGNNELPKFIDRARTIDAVPVVRCKDCKHFRTFRTSSDGEEIRACVGKGIVDLNYDDFCSKGERKDNE